MGDLISVLNVLPDFHPLLEEQRGSRVFHNHPIDGRRTIGQIVDTVEGSGLRTRDFFQKLWWYDEVVFDTSKA